MQTLGRTLAKFQKDLHNTFESVDITRDLLLVIDNIRIYHGCEGGIEKSVLRFTNLHQEAC